MADSVLPGPGPGPMLAGGVQAGAKVSLPPLPALREDLALHVGPALKSGAPSWVVEDPLRGRFFRIGWLEFELLSRWGVGDAVALAQRVSQETLLSPSVDEVLAVREFLLSNELAADPARLAATAAGRVPRPGLASTVLHHYLMFRVPLVNPDAFLGALLPVVRPLLGRVAFALSLLAGLLGLWIASLQWDNFLATFVETLSLQGLLSYALALIAAKVLHEFGHAFTAKRLGLRVARMGVAIVLMFPMLYTDTSETWRLARRRDRFSIAAAGMRIELMLAAWCTLAWGLLPDGPWRSACFFLATTSWLMTLAINASPFLRFDGYYMASDAAGIPNLHEAASAELRHFLRRVLLGINDPPPAVEGDRAPRWLLPFAAATAAYRLVLFLGIAIAVYHYFFKLLGIFLFAVEIWWFVLRPVVRELHQWWLLRARVPGAAVLRLAALAAVLAALWLLPWQSRVYADGWLRAGQEYALHAPRTAVLRSAPRDGEVRERDTVATLVSPEIGLREERASARMASLSIRLSAEAAADAGAGGRAQTPSMADTVRSTRAQWDAEQQEMANAAQEAGQLLLRAPFTGRLVDVAHDAQPGTAVGNREPMARVIDASHWIAEAFVDEDDVRRLTVGARYRAYTEGVSIEAVSGRIISIDAVPIEALPAEMLAARHGGKLATVDEGDSLKPRRSLYRVRCTVETRPGMAQARLASFALEARRTSLTDSLWRGLTNALLLEASF